MSGSQDMSVLFAVESSRLGSTETITVRGDVDLSNVERLQGAVGAALRRHPERIVLDLSEVTFCDSSGLKAVVAAQRRAAERRMRFVAIRPSGPAWRVFELCNLDREVAFVSATSSEPQPSAGG